MKFASSGCSVDGPRRLDDQETWERASLVD